MTAIFQIPQIFPSIGKTRLVRVQPDTGTRKNEGIMMTILQPRV